jgi:hypothetical protein
LEAFLLDLHTFLDLPASEIARLANREKRRTCVFPINGTRRWYLLERSRSAAPLPVSEEAYLRDYMDRSAENHRQLYRLLFEHGIHTLLTSLFGASLLQRGDTYISIGLNYGLAQIARDPAFRQLFDELGVRVRFYGDFRRVFPKLGYGHLLDLLDEVTEATSRHDRHLLLYGLCADDPVDSIARLSIEYFQAHGRPPTRQELVTLYYGESVEPVDLFIGFDKFCVFDMPLLATGEEDLYFTVSPSPYLSARQLRLILYDHLYSRRISESDYVGLSAETLEALRQLYELNAESVLGVGRQDPRGSFWYPLPQVKLPPVLS